MTKSKTLLLAMFFLTSYAVTTPLSVVAQPSEIVIDSRVEWIEDRSLEVDLRIVEGGELTLNDLTLDINDGVNIIVESGGILNLQNSHIQDKNPPTALAGYGYWDEDNRSSVLIPGSNNDGAFEAIFYSGETSTFYGGQAIIEGQDPIDLNGSEFTLSFDSNTEDVWVGLVGYGHQSVHLATVTMTPEIGSSTTYNAIDLDYRNMMGLDQDSETCVLNIAGNADFDEASILGCMVVVDGIMTLHSTTIDRTGPIISNKDAELILSGETTFSMSKDDHDVRAHANSVLHWGDNVVGSGGHTDRWEKIMDSQEVHFDAAGVLFRILNFGQYEITSSTYFSDENGVGLIDSGDSRTVEIGWADGSVWTESASIEILEYRTGWNMDETLDDYGGGLIPLTWDEVIVIDGNTPQIEFVSLDYQEPTESVSRGSSGVGLMATIANRGTAPAIVYFTCDVTETESAAQTTSYPGGLVEAGEEVIIQFTWMNSDVDNASLTCEILTPTQLVDENAFGGGTASSEQITWVDAEDEEDGSILPVAVAFVIAILGMGAFFFKMTKSSEDNEEELY
ncbi:MAG: hypothetical protein VYA23_05160 [Candidatus Thermoplasmatota archaeon]|nr:hypothetical protein [Candidatus Thermoplasmatota archaeon]